MRQNTKAPNIYGSLTMQAALRLYMPYLEEPGAPPAQPAVPHRPPKKLQGFPSLHLRSKEFN